MLAAMPPWPLSPMPAHRGRQLLLRQAAQQAALWPPGLQLRPALRQDTAMWASMLCPLPPTWRLPAMRGCDGAAVRMRGRDKADGVLRGGVPLQQAMSTAVGVREPCLRAGVPCRALRGVPPSGGAHVPLRQGGIFRAQVHREGSHLWSHLRQAAALWAAHLP
mmetsp:Transcript_29184/g.75589  ORF Transcript_29184/g.75589 Transcript_29184/m.75589 type:complete len:163 (-) Transcript_29184:85-573(-)